MFWPTTRTLGWVNFALVSNFIQRHVVCYSPSYNIGKYQTFLIFLQKPVRATYPFKGQTIKNKEIIFGKINSIISLLYSNLNQLLNKKS